MCCSNKKPRKPAQIYVEYKCKEDDMRNKDDLLYLCYILKPNTILNKEVDFSLFKAETLTK